MAAKSRKKCVGKKSREKANIFGGNLKKRRKIQITKKIYQNLFFLFFCVCASLSSDICEEKRNKVWQLLHKCEDKFELWLAVNCMRFQKTSSTANWESEVKKNKKLRNPVNKTISDQQLLIVLLATLKSYQIKSCRNFSPLHVACLICFSES